MWATGVILYEILAGRRPFEGKTITSLVYRIVHEPLPPPRLPRARMPEPLVGAAMKALSKDPSERFHDMAEMARRPAARHRRRAAPEPLLDPAVRKRAFERNYEEAQRLRSENDLSGALESGPPRPSLSTRAAPASSPSSARSSRSSEEWSP